MRESRLLLFLHRVTQACPRALLVACLALPAAAPELGAEQWQRPSLRDLPGVRVSVEGIRAESAAVITSDTLKARAERRLREAGVPVLGTADSAAERRTATLHVQVATVPLTAEPLSAERLGYAYVCGLSLFRLVWPMSSAGAVDAKSPPIVAATWETSTVGVAGVDETPDRLLRALDEPLDEFINDWLATHRK